MFETLKSKRQAHEIKIYETKELWLENNDRVLQVLDIAAERMRARLDWNLKRD